MNPTFSISIQAMQSRSKWVSDLFLRLDRRVPVSFGDGISLYENHRRAWELRDGKSDYHLLLEDDAILCQDFVKKAGEFLATVPKGAPVNFFFGAWRSALVTLAQSQEASGRIISPLYGGVAVCLPQSIIPDMLEFTRDSRLSPETGGMDTRMQKFLVSARMKVHHPMPSLVDHRDQGTLVTGPDYRNRKAYKFIDDL